MYQVWLQIQSHDMLSCFLYYTAAAVQHLGVIICIWLYYISYIYGNRSKSFATVSTYTTEITVTAVETIMSLASARTRKLPTHSSHTGASRDYQRQLVVIIIKGDTCRAKRPAGCTLHSQQDRHLGWAGREYRVKSKRSKAHSRRCSRTNVIVLVL